MSVRDPAPMLRIAAITTVRNDAFFLAQWLRYYGRHLGPRSLYVVLDGLDQPEPQAGQGATFIPMPHVPRPIVAADRMRARRLSHLAAALFHSYDMVIGTDVDEFLAVDPRLGVGLADYLSGLRVPGSVSGLGLDVLQHPDAEGPLDPARPILSQRGHAIVSDRYTKPVVLNRPLRWGSGLHRIKGRNFRIDPNLFLLHLGNVDIALAARKSDDADRIGAGWAAHLGRRQALHDKLRHARPIPGDDRFASARRRMALLRPPYAWNKPGVLGRDDVITLPERFREIL